MDSSYGKSVYNQSGLDDLLSSAWKLTDAV